jgi:hypothetical protein
MKVEISQIVKKTIDIELPIFRKNSCSVVKINNENESIYIGKSDHNLCIQKYEFVNAYDSGLHYEDCTENEFAEAFAEVSEKLIKLIKL